jgi:hypothetical protein
MKTEKDDQDGPKVPMSQEPPPRPSPPDTSSDWDEWMEKQGGRPRPRPDVAGADGKLGE